MASLANDPGGTRRVLVVVDGKRRVIRLGKMPKKQAESIVRHVEALAAAKIDNSTPPDETSRWLANASDTLRERLAKIGLATSRRGGRKASTVGELIEQFGSQRFGRLKPRTISNYTRSFARFAAHVGSKTLVADVTQGDAEALRDALLNEGYAEASVRRRCADACILLGYAVKHQIIDRNPFTDSDTIPRKIRGTKRTAEVTREDFAKVLAVETDLELRAAYCLSRFGGLRVPSELGGLRWSDIDWGRKRFRVLSPKTERHEGKGERIVPLFDELTAPLEALYVQREGDDDEAFVLPTLRERPTNYVARRMVAAVKRADLKPWPRTMHNMRATRQTELVNLGFSVHVVCAWLGNSPEVANEAYLRVHDSDFARAVEVAQNPAQSGPATAGSDTQKGTQPEKENPPQSTSTQGFAA